MVRVAEQLGLLIVLLSLIAPAMHGSVSFRK